MEAKLALTTVTYNNRETLLHVVRNFLRNTILSKQTYWYMALQNCSDEFVLRLLKEFSAGNAHNLTLVIARFPTNIGLSKAMTYLIEQTKYFDFTLNIEDDWILLDKCCAQTWLDTSLTFLCTHDDASAVFLRAYANEKDKWQYGWTRNIPYRCHEYRDNFNYETGIQRENVTIEQDGMRFKFIPNFLYTFNPVIAKNKDYHRHVYPIPILTNDQKDPNFHANWGCCEALVMERTRKAGLKTFWLNEGIFGHHEDFFP